MALRFVTLIWVAAGILIAWNVPKVRDLQATPAAFFHVPMAVGMLLAFLVAAVYGVVWLVKRSRAADAYSLAFAEVGFAFGIIALVTGAVWAKINWNAYWSWDPQQIGIVAALMTYAALFSLRGATEDEARRRNAWAVFAILGVISAVFWTYGFRHLMPSLHPSQTLTSSAPTFKNALRFNIIGIILLMTWISQIRVRLLLAQERLENAREERWALSES
jgi:heme exporter protein C